MSPEDFNEYDLNLYRDVCRGRFDGVAGDIKSLHQKIDQVLLNQSGVNESVAVMKTRVASLEGKWKIVVGFMVAICVGFVLNWVKIGS